MTGQPTAAQPNGSSKRKSTPVVRSSGPSSTVGGADANFGRSRPLNNVGWMGSGKKKKFRYYPPKQLF